MITVIVGWIDGVPVNRQGVRLPGGVGQTEDEAQFPRVGAGLMGVRVRGKVSVIHRRRAQVMASGLRAKQSRIFLSTSQLISLIVRFTVSFER